MAGTQHAGFDLGTVVGLPVVIFFDDNQRDRLYLFIGRKTFAAHIAYPAAANRVIIIGWTDVYKRQVPYCSTKAPPKSRWYAAFQTALLHGRPPARHAAPAYCPRCV